MWEGDLDNLYTRYTIDGDKIDTRTEEIRRLKVELLSYKTEERFDAALRMEHPGLKEAWEKYQVMLKLIKGKK